jgi:hypothetical protein
VLDQQRGAVALQQRPIAVELGATADRMMVRAVETIIGGRWTTELPMIAAERLAHQHAQMLFDTVQIVLESRALRSKLKRTIKRPQEIVVDCAGAL